jgi:hypothetical protein
MVAQALSHFAAARRARPETDGNFGKDHSLNYVVAVAAIGLFFSIMSVALTGIAMTE